MREILSANMGWKLQIVSGDGGNGRGGHEKRWNVGLFGAPRVT